MITVKNYHEHKPDRATLSEADQELYDIIEDGGMDFYGEDATITEGIDSLLKTLNEREAGNNRREVASEQPKTTTKALTPKSSGASAPVGGEPSPPRWKGPAAEFRVGELVRVRPVPAGSWVVFAHQQENAGREATISKVKFEKGKLDGKTTYHVEYVLDFGDGKGSHRYSGKMLERVSAAQPAPAEPSPEASPALKRGDDVRTPDGSRGTIIGSGQTPFGRMLEVKMYGGGGIEMFKPSSLTLVPAVTADAEPKTKQKRTPKAKRQAEPKYKRGARVFMKVPGADHRTGTVKAVRLVDEKTGQYAADVLFDDATDIKSIFENMLHPLTEEPKERPASKRKSADKPTARPKKERKPKAAKSEPTGVRALDPSVQFIRAYVALNGKALPVMRMVALLKRVQKAALERKVRATDRYADEIMAMQNELVQIANKYTVEQTVTLEIPTDDLAKLLVIAGGEKVYTSIGALKAYVGLIGQSYDETKVGALLKRLQSKAIKSDDPLRAEVDEAIKHLEKWEKAGKGKLKVEGVGLSGTNRRTGIGALLGAIDRHGERVSQPAKPRKPGCNCKH